jgi:hypothetical protein
MKRLFLVGVLVLPLSACAIFPQEQVISGNIYNLDTGAVLKAAYKWDRTGHGEAWMTTEAGIRCSGHYATQLGGYSASSVGVSQGWGSVYGWGAGGFVGASAQSYAVSSGAYSVRPNTQVGFAIFHCEDRNIIQCEYIVDARTNRGNGFCTDSKNMRYRFVH